MTAMNIIRRHDEIIIISDGAAYADGTLLAAAPKVQLLAHFAGFVMQSGGSAWTPAIAAVFAIMSDIDDLFDKVEWLLPEIEAKYHGISEQPMGRVLFGGWSESKGRMRLGAVFSAAAADLKQDGGGAVVIQPEAWTLQEFEGDQLLTQPPIGKQLWIEALGGPVYDLAQIKNIEEFASNLLAAQRTIGAPHRGVGAFGQITRITKDESTTRIFERYPDEIGEVMMPLEFDWKARRARPSPVRNEAHAPRLPATASGMSRQQRRAAEAQQRKGLRVV